jgi:hypothetical protein
MLKEGEAEALLVVKLDRLTRSVVDLGTLVERYFAPGKAALLSVGEQIDTRSAAGRLVLNVLASVSQIERCDPLAPVVLQLGGGRPISVAAGAVAIEAPQGRVQLLAAGARRVAVGRRRRDRDWRSRRLGISGPPRPTRDRRRSATA